MRRTNNETTRKQRRNHRRKCLANDWQDRKKKHFYPSVNCISWMVNTQGIVYGSYHTGQVVKVGQAGQTKRIPPVNRWVEWAIPLLKPQPKIIKAGPNRIGMGEPLVTTKESKFNG